MAAALQVAVSTPLSDRLKQTLRMTPRLLDVYFAIAVRDYNNCMSVAVCNSEHFMLWYIFKM